MNVHEIDIKKEEKIENQIFTPAQEDPFNSFPINDNFSGGSTDFLATSEPFSINVIYLKKNKMSIFFPN